MAMRDQNMKHSSGLGKEFTLQDSARPTGDGRKRQKQRYDRLNLGLVNAQDNATDAVARKKKEQQQRNQVVYGNQSGQFDTSAPMQAKPSRAKSILDTPGTHPKMQKRPGVGSGTSSSNDKTASQNMRTVQRMQLFEKANEAGNIVDRFNDAQGLAVEGAEFFVDPDTWLNHTETRAKDAMRKKKEQRNNPERSWMDEQASSGALIEESKSLAPYLDQLPEKSTKPTQMAEVSRANAPQTPAKAEYDQPEPATMQKTKPAGKDTGNIVNTFEPEGYQPGRRMATPEEMGKQSPGETDPPKRGRKNRGNRKGTESPTPPGMAFEAFLDYEMGMAGGRKVSGFDNKTGAVFGEGPYKGMTLGQMTEAARKKFQEMTPEQRKQWLKRAKMEDVRSPGEKKKIAQYNDQLNLRGDSDSVLAGRGKSMLDAEMNRDTRKSGKKLRQQRKNQKKTPAQKVEDQYLITLAGDLNDRTNS